MPTNLKSYRPKINMGQYTGMGLGFNPTSIMERMLAIRPDTQTSSSASGSGYSKLGGGSSHPSSVWTYPGAFSNTGTYAPYQFSRSASSGTSGQADKIRAMGSYLHTLTPQLFQQQKFDRVFPWVQGISAQGSAPGGEIYSPQLIQQMVNSMRAQNDATARTNIQRSAEGLASRGFTATSPIQDAMSRQYLASALQANTQGELGLRTTAAEQNAAFGLDAERNQLQRLRDLYGFLGQFV